MPKSLKVKTKFEAEENISKTARKVEKNTRRMNRVMQAGFKASTKSAARFGRTMKSVAGVGAKAMAAGAIAATVAVAAAVVKTAELGDEAAKTSRRLGISAESLQELRFAADRQGVSSKLLDSSFTALQKRVGELKSGTGALYGFLKKDGDKTFAKQLAGAKNTGEAFRMMTAKMATIKDPMKKAAFASAAFSRAGIDMIKMMEAGNNGIDDLRQQARKYGAVISNDAAGKSELFIDAMTNMKAALGGIGMTIGSRLMPVLTPLIQKFADFWAANRGDIVKSVENGFRSFVNVIIALKPAAQATFEILKAGFDMIVWASPFLKPFVASLLVFKGVLIAVGIATKAWAASQLILNAVLTANPIGLIIVGVSALIAGLVLMVKHWDAVKAAINSILAPIKKVFSYVESKGGIIGTLISAVTGMDPKGAGAGADGQPGANGQPMQPAFAGSPAPIVNVGVETNVNAKNVETETTVKAPGTSGGAGKNKF